MTGTPTMAHEDSTAHEDPTRPHSENASEEVIRPSRDKQITQAVQRTLDFLFSLLICLVLLPAFAVIALLIRLESRGPVLFVQKRVGKGGRVFSCYKFRSMVVDAESRHTLLQSQNERNGPVFKMRNDPRITRVGRLLRRASLDELPQLINVVKGDMSLIGPRPALPREVALYTPRQRRRLAVTPGLTGLWQVSGRADLSFEESIELDLTYVSSQTLGMNLKILLMTIPAIVSGKGAY